MLEKYLKKLIEFKTITRDFDKNGEALSWIEDQIADLPLYIKRYEKNGFKSLVITTKKTKTPKIMLAAHLDVVKGSDNVFKPTITDGKLYGRGVFDMKYAIACYLKLLIELKAELPNLDLGIIITTDEEIGGANGVNYLLNEEKYSADICVLPDGGVNWQLITESKGILQIKVKSSGKSAHGSKPWLGESAIDNLLNFLQVLKKDKIFDENYYQRADEHYCNTVNVGKISGGEVANQVADCAEATLDVRFVSKENEDGILDLIKKAAKKSVKIEIEKIISGYPLHTDENNSYVREFVSIAKQNGINIKSTFTHGSSDARFFGENKIPVIVLRPNGGGHHSEQEWIDIESLNEFYKILKMFIIGSY
ncbi:MAG: M20/M25/M40 family metallo-hydrolase [Candidatus Saccharimonadales bacterium]